MLGFWIYLMSDCLIFAMLFATYGVLGSSYAGGPGPKELFDLPLIALNTSILLLSSITYGFAMLAMNEGKRGAKARTQTAPEDAGFHAFLVECKDCKTADERRSPCALCGGA